MSLNKIQIFNLDSDDDVEFLDYQDDQDQDEITVLKIYSPADPRQKFTL
jgi:hypothetical protein